MNNGLNEVLNVPTLYLKIICFYIEDKENLSLEIQVKNNKI
jgi:hypothetical protein